MTPADQALARRAVACAGWRWLPGMLVDAGGNVYRITEHTLTLGMGSPEYQRDWIRPNLTDPATLGCLLALVREAHEAQDAHAAPDPYHCWVCVVPGVGLFDGPNEAAALVAALEAA